MKLKQLIKMEKKLKNIYLTNYIMNGATFMARSLFHVDNLA